MWTSRIVFALMRRRGRAYQNTVRIRRAGNEKELNYSALFHARKENNELWICCLLLTLRHAAWHLESMTSMFLTRSCFCSFNFSWVSAEPAAACTRAPRFGISTTTQNFTHMCDVCVPIKYSCSGLSAVTHTHTHTHTFSSSECS